MIHESELTAEFMDGLGWVKDTNYHRTSASWLSPHGYFVGHQDENYGWWIDIDDARMHPTKANFDLAQAVDKAAAEWSDWWSEFLKASQSKNDVLPVPG